MKRCRYDRIVVLIKPLKEKREIIEQQLDTLLFDFNSIGENNNSFDNNNKNNNNNSSNNSYDSYDTNNTTYTTPTTIVTTNTTKGQY